MTAVDRLLETARREVGYLEKATNDHLDHPTDNAGRGNWTKYARDLDDLGVYNGKKNGYDWCDVFVDWCLIRTFGLTKALTMSYQPRGGYGAGCTSSANYYRRAGRWHDTPEVGDQIFFSGSKGSMSHTGLVVAVTATHVHTIEGNTSSAPGVVANGGCVRVKTYRRDYARIVGYGRPNYSIVEDDNMDLETFGKLFAEYRRQLQDNDCGEWSREAREWAISTGLVAGGDPLPNGEANYMWADMLTREQMVMVLYRFAQALGKAGKA